jgi:uncharacterized membrane protein
VPNVESGHEADRVVFFSDAVFAIAMTLLAVGIRVPAVARDQVASAISHLAGPIAGYFLTFAVIGVYWVTHHRMFGYIERIDTGLIALNLVLLSLIALMPVPSDLLGRDGGRAAVIFYAVVVSLVGLATAALWLYATIGHRLVSPDLPRHVVVGSALRSLSVPLVFGLSIPIALASPTAAEWFWLTLVVSGVALRRSFRHQELTAG